MEKNRGKESPELANFAGVHVAVDLALLTIAPGPLGVKTLAALAHKRQDGLATGQWALVGRMLRERERLAQAVQIALREKAGIVDIKPRQLFVLDEPTRDSRGWVMSVAHVATCKWSDLEPIVASSPNLDLIYINGNKPRFTLPEKQSSLPFENDLILNHSISDIRRRYLKLPDPDYFLGKEFTIRELREIHEIVANKKFDKDMFRRKVIDQLTPTGIISEGSMGKPAQLFKRK